MNPKLFRAIVVVGAALGGCRTEPLALRDLSIADASRVDQAQPIDQAMPFDMAGDLQICCTFPGEPLDLSGCIPIECILI